jgi:hypothetical protein
MSAEAAMNPDDATPADPRSDDDAPEATNPGEVAGGTYGRDRAGIARRSTAHIDRDHSEKLHDGKREPALEDEPAARAGWPKP